MPCYDFDYDMGVYGFVGNNGIKITTVKKMESSIQETSSEIKLKGVSEELLKWPNIIIPKICKLINIPKIVMQGNSF
jgi:hypothetical protein